LKEFSLILTVYLVTFAVSINPCSNFSSFCNKATISSHNNDSEHFFNLLKT